MKKRVLIFTASTGYGHNQVAASMKQELEHVGYEVEIHEPFKEVSRSLDALVSDGYRVLATRMPKMYGKIYKMSNNQILNKSVEKISISAIEDKLEEIVNNYQPDLVISTHPLIVKAMSYLKRCHKYNGPFVSIITDYLPHACYISTLVDAYIVGSDYTKQRLLEKGILESRIFVHGIPINRSFNETSGTMIKDDRFTLLLMGGSMGVNGIKKVFKNILQLDMPLKLIVVCGNNKNLKKYLEKKIINEDINKNIDVALLGFTNHISEYMDVADVIITKPGGLTVTEAFAKNVPMIIPYYIPGQEAENADMLVELGASLKTDRINDLGELIEALINDPTILVTLKENMLKVSKDHSLDMAVQVCKRLIEQDMVGMRYAK